MENHRNLTDFDFMNQFEACIFPSSDFTHEAHLRLAWINISKHGLRKAIPQTERLIIAYVNSLGAESKYHATVTIGAVKAVGHFMNLSQSNTFSDFIDKNSALLTDFKGLLRSHYSFDIFNSEEAKTTFIEPDLQEF